MITILAYDPKRKVVRSIQRKELKGFLRGKRNTVWVDLDRPNKEDYGILADPFNFHPLSIEDAQKPQSLPKIDTFPDYLFLTFHKVLFDFKEQEIDVKEIDFFLGRNFLVTVHHYDSQVMAKLKETLSRNPALAAEGADFLLHRIIDSIVDQYLPLVDGWEDEIDAMEDRIFRKRLKGVLEATLRTRRNITKFRKSIAPQREIITRLARRDSPFISPRASVYFRDVYDHLTRAQSMLDVIRETLHAAFEAYLSIISNHMAVVSNRLNKVMQRLTVISTIFLPLTFIAGVYGMNFDFMPELRWKYGYLLVWIIFIALPLGMLYYFKTRKWMT